MERCWQLMGGTKSVTSKIANRGRKKKYVVLGYHEQFPSLKEKKKWKLEIWQSGKITRDLCLSPDCSDREKGCWKVNKGIFVDGVKAVWHDDVISSKMRETMLVGGKLSSRSPHYEGSEREDSVEVVKRGLDPFWWRFGDHSCLSQNLPQNIGNYYINRLIFELSS